MSGISIHRSSANLTVYTDKKTIKPYETEIHDDLRLILQGSDYT